MATHYDETHHLVIDGDDARSGVTGHNVRYVLFFSMTGVILAFTAIGVYFGFDRLQEGFTAALARNPSEVIRAIAPYGAIIFLGSVLGAVMLGVWNLVAGHSEDDGESFMRMRVATQFALICIMMAMLYVSQT